MYELIKQRSLNIYSVLHIGNSAWIIVEKFIRLIINLFIFSKVTGYLTEDQFGSFQYYQGIIALLIPFWSFGTNEILKRKITASPDRELELLSSAFTIKLFNSLALLIFLFFYFFILGGFSDTNLFAFIIMGCFFFRSFDVIEILYDTKCKSKLPSITRNISFLICSLSYLSCISLNLPLIYFGVVFSLEFLLNSIGYLIIMSSEKKRIKHLFQKFTYRAIIELLKESLPLLLCGIFIMGQSRISHVMLNIYLNKAAVGHFAIILKMSELWLFIPAGLALSMFGPLLREHKKDGHIYQVKVQKMFSLFTFISLSIALASIPFIDPVMDFLFAEKFNFSTTPIILLLFSNIFVFWGFAQEPIDLAENLLIFRVFRAGTGIVTNILLQIVLIPRFGITGAAISIFISYAVTYSLINLATSKSRKIFVWQLKSFAFWKHL